jgi:5'-deoxynucleotidase
VAREKLLGTLPAALLPDYRALLAPGPAEGAYLAIVKAADKLCAYIKCLEETGAGNREFAEAEKVLRKSVESVDLPEVRYFLATFVPSFRLTLDELK